MTREFSRTQRLGEQIQRELGALLLFEASDPRLHNVVVTDVEVSRDLALARVYVAVSEGGDVEQTMSALAGAAGFLRGRLAPRLHVRAMPELRFEHDTSLERARRIESLLASVREADEPDEPDEPDSDDDARGHDTHPSSQEN